MQRIREELETLKNNGQYRSIPDIFCKANNKIIIEVVITFKISNY